MGALILALVLTFGCKANNSNNNSNNKNCIKLLPTFYADYTNLGATAGGYVKAAILANKAANGYVEYAGNGKAVRAALGEQADLGTTLEGSSALVTVAIYADSALKRIFNNVSMYGTQEFRTDVLNLDGFDINGYVNDFLVADYNKNKNNRWDVPNVKVSFNPDYWKIGNQIYGTGKRLPQEYITTIENEIRDLLLNNTSGFIKNLAFDYNGDKIADPTVPPDGEVWVFSYIKPDQSVGNFNYPIGGSSIKSAVFVINPERIPPIGAVPEVRNMFIGGDQDSDVWLQDYKKYYRFSFRRPAGGSYRVYTDREEQEGFSNLTDGEIRNIVAQPLRDYSNDSSLLNPLGNLTGPDIRRPSARTPTESQRSGTVKENERIKK